MTEHFLDRFARLTARTFDRRTILAALTAALLPRSGTAAPSSDGGLVFDYYQAIDRRDYKAAYGYLGAAFTAVQTLEAFTAGFRHTVFDELVVRAVHPDPDRNRIVYEVEITAWHDDRSIHHFSGTYTEGREGGEPKLIAASIAEAQAASSSPLCRAEDLDATLRGDAGAGQRYGVITVTNIATERCVLGGIPKVVIRDSSGRTLITGKPEANTAITTVTLRPDGQADLAIRWSNWCGEPVAGEPELTVAFYGGNGRISGLIGMAVPPCLSDPGGTSTLSVRPWQRA